MSRQTANTLLKAGVGVAAALGATMSFSAPARASEAWRFERVKGGGYAQSCQTRRGRQVCATVYCGIGVDEWGIGLTGWGHRRGAPDERIATIEIDGRAVNRQLDHVNDPVVGEVWRVTTRRGGDRLVDQLQAGYRLSFDFARRGRPFDFTLTGSHDAIAALERRCERIDQRVADRRGGRDGDVEIAEGLRLDHDGFVIGNDDFQIRLNIGKPEDRGRLSPRQVRRLFDRRGFRRVTDIDYRPKPNTYAVDAVNRRGVKVRVVVDAETGKFRRIRRL